MKQSLTLISICTVIVLDIIVLAGWQFNIITLRSLLPNAPQTTPLTALILLGLGTALLLYYKNQAGPAPKGYQLASRMLAGITLLVTAWSGIQYAFNLDPSIELVLYSDLLTQQGGLYPGRPSPYTIVTSLLLGSAVIFSTFPQPRWIRLSMILVLTGTIIPWLALFGYASTISPFYALPSSPATGMSPLTAIGFIAIMMSVTSLHPEHGFFNVLTSSSSGGWLMRRLLPISIGLPLLFGWLLTSAQLAEAIDASVAFALSWGISSLLFTAMVIVGGFFLHDNEIEKNRITEERELLLEQLERSNRELQQFAYIASHDLQAPLRRIGGFAQLLAQTYQGKLDSRGDDWIRRVQDGTNQMENIIRDILNYSKVESRAIAFEAVDLSELFKETLTLLETSIQDSQAKVTQSGLPVVAGDRSQLLQLLLNFVGNAIKYRGEQTPLVHISATQQDGNWRIAVQDNGIGIGPEHRESIFQIFRRLHTQQEYPGTGIGLAICQRVVERHGGSVWVESETGSGSTFYFLIPQR